MTSGISDDQNTLVFRVLGSLITAGCSPLQGASAILCCIAELWRMAPAGIPDEEQLRAEFQDMFWRLRVERLRLEAPSGDC